MGTQIIPLLSTLLGSGRGAFHFRGEINIPSDFPLLSVVKDGDVYKITLLPRSVTSITRIGSVANVTTTAPHNLSNGVTVTIKDAVEPEYNGTFVISNVAASTFDYTVPGTPTTPATGTIIAQPDTIIDDDATKTNTGQILKNNDIVAWAFGAPNKWIDITGIELWNDNGTTVFLIVPRDIDLQDKGLRDQYATTGIMIADANNTTLLTTSKNFIGSINELNERFVLGLKNPHGFPDITTSEILYNPTTRDITLQPKAPATSYDYFIKGVKYSSSATQVKNHTTATGVYFLYYDENNVLQFSSTMWDLLKDVPVSYVIYNLSLADGFHNEERHGANANPAHHLELHERLGTYIPSINDFVISGYTPSPGAPVDADNTFALSSGIIADEDLRPTLLALADGGPYTLFYRSGASGEWLWNKVATLPFFVGASYVEYNQFTGAVWQLTETATNNWINQWVFKIPSINGSFQTIIVTGQNVHTSLLSAKGENAESIQWGNLPFQEIAPLYKITYRTQASYSSTGKCRIEEVERLKGSKASLTGVTQTSHGALTNLQKAAAGVNWGHIDDQPQTIAGVKTYSSIVKYLSHPTFLNDEDHIDKKYFDDNVPLSKFVRFTNPTPGTPTIPIGGTPQSPTTSSAYLNGSNLTYNIDYTITGSNFNWINAVRPLVATDNINLRYDFTLAGLNPIKQIVMSATDYSSNNDNYRTRAVSGTGAHRFSFPCPFDFNSLVSAEAIFQVSSGAAGANKDIDLTTSYGQTDGSEPLNQHTQTDSGTLYDFTGLTDRATRIDISGLLTSLSANDWFGLFWDNNGINGALELLGIDFRFR